MFQYSTIFIFPIEDHLRQGYHSPKGQRSHPSCCICGVLRGCVAGEGPRGAIGDPSMEIAWHGEALTVEPPRRDERKKWFSPTYNTVVVSSFQSWNMFTIRMVVYNKPKMVVAKKMVFSHHELWRVKGFIRRRWSNMMVLRNKQVKKQSRLTQLNHFFCDAWGLSNQPAGGLSNEPKLGHGSARPKLPWSRAIPWHRLAFWRVTPGTGRPTIFHRWMALKK